MKKMIYYTVILFMSVSFSIILGESLLRFTGRLPWIYSKKDANEPIMHKLDPILGWTNKEGEYVVPSYDFSGKNIHITFISHGQRSTRSREINSNKEFVIVGGSYTQGWAIDDNETYPWKLQRRYPLLDVLNYGTAAYGSYQSLLILEKELPRLVSPISVLYGFIQDHEVRNIASAEWLEALSRYSRRGHVFVPYVTLKENTGLIRHPPERYLSLPFRESLAMIALIERVYMRIKTKKRYSQKRAVTEQILLEMNRITEKFSAKFILVMLSASDETKSHYMNFSQAHNIRYINCVYPSTPEMRVAGEGHPNGKMNSLWAACIANELGDQEEIMKWSSQGMQLTR